MDELGPLLLGDFADGPLDPDLQSLFTQEYLTEYNQNSNYSSKRINKDMMKKLKMQTMLSKAKRQHNYLYTNLQKCSQRPFERIREHLKLISDGRNAGRNDASETSGTGGQKVKMVVVGKQDESQLQRNTKNREVRQSEQYEAQTGEKQWRKRASASNSPKTDRHNHSPQTHNQSNFSDLQKQIIAKIQSSRHKSTRDSFTISKIQEEQNAKSQLTHLVDKNRLTATANPPIFSSSLKPAGLASPRFHAIEGSEGSDSPVRLASNPLAGHISAAKDSLEQEEEINQQLKMMENYAI